MLLVFNLAYSQQQGYLENIYRFIEDPGKFAENQEVGHVPLVPFASVQDAIENDWNKSTGFLSLNGNWKFKWSENPEQSLPDFFSTSFNDSKWDNLSVPGNWEMQGYGDPVFRNISQPFISNPPFIPRDYNPVGSYRKVFTLPSAWKGKEVFLHMEGTTSASFVWVNGKEVGYNQGANEPVEYNITKYLKTGKNLIAVNVYKYSAGTYLEDQDFWRLSGIFRDVYLLATPEVHLRDYFVNTEFDSDYRDASLSISAEIANYSKTDKSDYSVRINLFDKSGNAVVKDNVSELVSIEAEKTLTVYKTCQVLRPDRYYSDR